MSNASLLYGRESNNFQQLSKLIEVKFISTTGVGSLLLQVKLTTRRKCMAKVISDNTKNVKLYINLAPYLS